MHQFKNYKREVDVKYLPDQGGVLFHKLLEHLGMREQFDLGLTKLIRILSNGQHKTIKSFYIERVQFEAYFCWFNVSTFAFLSDGVASGCFWSDKKLLQKNQSISMPVGRDESCSLPSVDIDRRTQLGLKTIKKSTLKKITLSKIYCTHVTDLSDFA